MRLINRVRICPDNTIILETGGEQVNIPNILTVIRFLLIPVFAHYLYIENFAVAVFIFVLAGITDIMDGFIARKFHLITNWGKLADPLADKLIQITALILLSIQHRIPIMILVIVAAKEIFMVIGSILVYRKNNKVVSANWYGKMATVILFLAIVLTLFKWQYSNVAVVTAVIATLFAFFMYSMTFTKIKNSES